MHYENPELIAAYRACLKLTRSHYENFPVASWLIPKTLRHHVATVYAFARTADDYADEAEHAGARMSKLNQWHHALSSSEFGTSSQPIFLALGQTRNEFDLPVKPFADLLTAFKMDVVKKEYATFNELLYYCERSANPVGRIVLHLFGYRPEHDAELFWLSDQVCTGLQLANFWQDVVVDLKKPRVYLPQSDMQEFGYSMAELKAQKLNSAFRELMRCQCDRATEYLKTGAAITTKVRGRLAWELKLTVLGGLRILEKIAAADYDVFAKRPTLNWRDKLTLSRRLIQKSLPWQPAPQPH